MSERLSDQEIAAIRAKRARALVIIARQHGAAAAYNMARAGYATHEIVAAIMGAREGDVAGSRQ